MFAWECRGMSDHDDAEQEAPALALPNIFEDLILSFVLFVEMDRHRIGSRR